MKFFLDVKVASVVLYLSVVCRHNLATVCCKSQVSVSPAIANISQAVASTPTATYTVVVAYRVNTGYSWMDSRYCNIT
jgi:hypothetical protein